MTTTIDMEWIQPDEREDKREDSCWYTFSGFGHDLVVTVRRGERAVSVYADGEMNIRVYEKTEGKLVELGRIRHCDDLTDFDITTDSDLWGLPHVDGYMDMNGPNKNGHYFEFVHNSWFDLYAGEDGEHLDAVCHELSDAISQATAIIEDNNDEIWKTSEV